MRYYKYEECGKNDMHSKVRFWKTRSLMLNIHNG